MHVRSNDTEISYDTSGHGPDVVLIHPFPSNRAYWRPISDFLAPRCRLVMPDLRGLGDSAPGEGIATMARHAEDLLRVIDDAGVNRATFVGCSIGGYILFEFWRRFPERFRALVLADTKAEADDESARQTRERAAEQVLLRGPEMYLNELLPKLIGQTTQRNRPDVFAVARASAQKSTAKGIAAVQRGMAARLDSVKTLSTIDIPTLVVCGDEDLPTPPAVMENMSRQIPRSRFQVIPTAGHFSALEQPDEFARTIRQVLDDLPSD